jgi:stage II sporulation protein D
MRQARLWKTCLTVSAVLICLLLWLALLSVESAESPASLREEPQLSQERPEPIMVLPPGEVDSSYTVRVLHGETMEEMPMNRYLQGVVRAEMPADFAEEALCAQAVAARTYTLYKMMTGTKHPQADICTDASCCQAYLAEEQAAEKWGMDAAHNEKRICNAVSATDGQTMVYEGEPILAVFHASSPGQTRRAGEVWSSDLPYLRSVSSPEDGTWIPDYYSRVELECDAFRKAFLRVHPEAVLTGDPAGWITELTTSEGSAHVDTVTVGGVAVRGVELRQIYGLRSAAFDVEVKDGYVRFFVTGYGHGVGMSQYGANEMAERGADWKEILMHYYTGIHFEVRGR